MTSDSRLTGDSLVPARFAATLTLTLVFLYEAGAFLFFGILGQPRTGLLVVGPFLVVLPLLGILRGTGFPVSETLRLHRVSPAAYVLGSIGMLGAVPPVLAVATRLTPVAEVTEQFFSDLLAAASLQDWFILLLGAAVVPSITEELLFRGFLQRSLEARWGRWPGILISAAAFGIIHGPTRALSAGALGAVLGWLTSRSGSVLPAILAHALVNALAISVVNTSGFGQGDGWPETLPLPALVIWGVISFAALAGFAKIHSRDASP